MSRSWSLVAAAAQFSWITPDPSILLHSNIPKALHEVNPRSILGSRWWNETRQAVYAEQDYHCFACGIHKLEAKARKHLEAHEMYQIDYTTGEVRLWKIAALCHYCHAYIHDGRCLHLLEAGDAEMPEHKYLAIMQHGNELLYPWLEKHCNGWQKGDCWKSPFQETQPFIKVFPYLHIPQLAEREIFPQSGRNAVWEQWHLILEVKGEEKRFYSKFADYDAWETHYAEKNARSKQKAEARYQSVGVAIANTFNPWR